jgi:dolichol kinase
MTFAAVATVFTALPTVVELVKRRTGVAAEIPPKIAHVCSGVLAAPLPYLLTYRQILVLAALFVAVMAASRGARIFTSLHDVERDSYGELLFPLGIGILALFAPKPWAFSYALLVLALADTSAAAVGMRFGRRRLPLGDKSVVGSASFFAVAFVVGLPFAPIGACAVVALAATTAEAMLSRGLDNAVLPVVAGLLIGIA